MGEPHSTEEPCILPTADISSLGEHISLLPPLSRRGYGPGLILILPEWTPTYSQGGAVCEDGVPPPLLKWAEEGFAVVEIREPAFKEQSVEKEVLEKAVTALEACEQCRAEGGIGLIVYDASIWNKTVSTVAFDSRIKAAVVYGATTEAPLASASIPRLGHLAGTDKVEPENGTDSKIYKYPMVKSSRFPIPCLEEFDSTIESVAHTRNLIFLKKYIHGADFDLEAIWDEHTYFEFEDRNVNKTMATMVQEPYVNHITTMTGGIGRERLTNFYRHHFIFNNPQNTEMVLVSRTIGIDRVVDEFIFKFTHDREIDWLVPGIPPTGKEVAVPFTAVVCVRGDRLYHEHISWDQASVLIQLGLMPEYLTYPHPMPDGTKPAPGKKFEYRVPAAGAELSVKMLDKHKVPSNGMFEYRIREVDL
ncbi:uncharacterized protein Z518_09932 [Rhinocladiella mackenziei CBS 650.93]|uniref:Carboxymethylenebutenolidase n=1 Tax=Rhinocladiella mackenziei CBS 650.93 TaxID=1442369 RepID=A0A0D2FFT4_9EURO|nr:uncharacterized protein Z518_09932 [Rhinocladiella mackenziei CBS 650.93]KIX00867.1 hypothetical protein Z518_09932 [Rhinocladiella mackenziei CBS 650.93]